mmetsp:Transcript_54994/g.116872  ORF Transcript_54994/g.116872 Transcript_54994/m.116872 type:complete len:150 (+) Transcript_54994:113-562(+)
MDSPSHQPQRRAVPLASRADVRRAVHGIILRVLRNSLAREQRRRASDGSDSSSDSTPTPPTRRLSEVQRRKALQRSRFYEDVLYRRASSVEEYSDPSTLVERVFKVGRSVCLASQRRCQESRRGRRSSSSSQAHSHRSSDPCARRSRSF